MSGLYSFVGALALVASEKEEAILLDGTADPCAERISVQNTWLIRLTGEDLRLLVEPIVSLSDVRTVVLIEGAVEAIGSARGYHVELGAR